MPTAFLRAIGHFIFPTPLLPVESPMDQRSSTPTEESTKYGDNSHGLYDLLSQTNAQPECPITRRKWILPEIIDKNITQENVLVYTSLSNTLCGDYKAEKIMKHAKKVFALLILIGCDQNTIERLLFNDRLTDDDLPLHIDRGFLVSVKTGKKFGGFLRRVDADNLVRGQWLFLPPVFDETDPNLKACLIRTLSDDCPLPLRRKEHLTSTNTSSVSKCELHSAYYRSDSPHVS